MSTVSAQTFFGGSVPPPPVSKPQVSSGDIHNSAWDQIVQSAKAGIGQAGAGYNLAAGAGNEIAKGGLGAVPGATAHLLEGGAALGAGVMNTAFSPLAPVINPTLGRGINTAGEALSNTPLMKAYGRDTASLGTQELGPERILNDISNVDTLAQGALGLKVPEGIKQLSNAIETKFKTPPAPPGVAEAALQAKTAAKVDTIAKEWQRPVDVPGNTFKNARAILEKDPSIPTFLVKEKIDPEMHIQDGRYTTLDTAEALRETAGQLSRDGLRPSLQMADYSTPKTPVGEVVRDAITNLSKDKESTPGDIQSAISAITKEGDALKAKYPDGLSLTDLHDNKITFSKNAGYSPIKDPATNIKANANRSLSSVMGDMVEQKAPEGVPVKDFNSYLSSYYKAADYLDSLNGKKAPTTLLQKARGAVLKFGSAALGQSFGGGIVSAFAGYTIGKALEHALENMSNPVRTAFLNNLQHTNPEAFTKVLDYLKQQTSGNTGIPRLNAPSSIQLPPPSEEVQMKGRALQPPEPTISPSPNPTTGIIEKVKGVYNDIKQNGNRGFAKNPFVDNSAASTFRGIEKNLPPLDKEDYTKYILPKLKNLPIPKDGETLIIKSGDGKWADTKIEVALNRGVNANTEVRIVKSNMLTPTGNAAKDARGERFLLDEQPRDSAGRYTNK